MSDWLDESLLAEFFSEVEEHLTNIRQQLLALETAEDRTPCIEEALRAYHTLKGITGMVGLESAMHLSHQMESLLKAVQQAAVPLTPEVVDVLLAGADALESLVARMRQPEAPEPDLTPLLDRTQKILAGGISEDAVAPASAVAPPEFSPPPPPPSTDILPLPVELPAPWPAQLDPPARERLGQGIAQGKALAQVVFTSGTEHHERGWTVDRVRQTVAALGEIVAVASETLPEAEDRVRFAFLVLTDPTTRPPEDAPLTWTWLYRPTDITPRAAPAGGQTGATLRVPLLRLDELMRLTGELLITSGRLDEVLSPWRRRWPELDAALRDPLRHLRRQLNDLREAVFNARLVPLEEVFRRLTLAVREVARATGKQVRLEIQGETVEVDKALAEQLAAPLLHLVRNAVAHGIETPEARQQAGKPPVGLVRVAAIPEGDTIRIEVGDDGRGLDLQAIAAKAHRLGLLPELRPITPEEALDLITRPGFSTREQADRSAGRGVGMDVVAGMVRSFRGSLSLHTEPGRGTTFVLRLPLTLTIVEVLLVEINGQRYAIPRNLVAEVIEVVPSALQATPAGWMYLHRGQSLPVVHLAALLAGHPLAGALPHGYGVLSHTRQGTILFTVDRIVGLREVLVYPLTDPLVARPGIHGATELGDGRAMLILDLDGVRTALMSSWRSS